MKHWYDFPEDVDLSRSGKSWTRLELIDLVGWYDILGAYDVALMLSRTYKTTCGKYWELKKQGKIEKYKKIFKDGNYY
ncbi:hypothetical protein IX317_001112 [Fusobacterium sp. DD29]|uniref:hypothetical protein n=1 Tax=unclassified Fusobacterium TaxID=2648384 RepID=UPI001B8CA273|nr:MULTISPECIES: hypothetical protein [unclassified Fusobacterium]MBR8701310.1 hypothetical protein [Fusobacterium sp. DD45]MBR8711074.1 hypothetical protein [Fusobacterium sp. DD28]MBR8749438.1 hypothetical protein [Fusobacterium sp. DD29]MBR8751648.1 hypothetical protein [Fusobacterium sp. DD26]MBR8761672.1 hypothetical protein [Fusobacterium sp. DD25]